MKLGVLFSGGKDSTYALYKAMQKNDVVCLITIISENKESYMFHTPNIEITKFQAEAVGLPLIKKKTKGEKEKELKELKDAIIEAKKKYRIEGVVTGAIESVYQSERIGKICKQLELVCINPLWKKDQEELLRELVKNNFTVIISGFFAYPMDRKWLGRKINNEIIDELIKLKDKYSISPSGEGGEIETTVLDAPFFKKRIEIVKSEIKTDENSGVFLIKKAKLVDK